MGLYDDIISLPRPVSQRHAAMPRADRAKQFMPFAALKGYDEAIADKQAIYEPRLELGEEQRDRLDAQLQALRQALARGERPRLSLCLFTPRPGWENADTPMGLYVRRTGVAEKMNLETGRLRLDGEWIPLREITAISRLDTV